MDDLISKHDALELVRDVCDAIMSYCGSHYDEETKDEVYDDIREVDAILKCNKEIRIALKNMPSVRTNVSNTNVGDTISRQAAIDLANELYQGTGIIETTYNGVRKAIIAFINLLPSAQPEKLTDKEQRIFLSAMGREEEVCKEVDDVWRDCRESYKDSLVHVCKEIRRKVKGALWT